MKIKYWYSLFRHWTKLPVFQRLWNNYLEETFLLIMKITLYDM